MTTIAQDTHLPEHIRVRLRYSTSAPTTETALLMAKQLGVSGPYSEEVWILIPKQNAFSILDAYQDAFTVLKDAGVVPADAALTQFKVDPGMEPKVLAYVIP